MLKYDPAKMVERAKGCLANKKEIIEELKKRKILKIFRKNSSFKEYRKMVFHIYFDIYLKLVR